MQRSCIKEIFIKNQTVETAIKLTTPPPPKKKIPLKSLKEGIKNTCKKFKTIVDFKSP